MLENKIIIRTKKALIVIGNLLVGIVFIIFTVEKAFSQDLSTLSDFGTSDILQNTSIVNQKGSANIVQVTQFASSGSQKGHYSEINQDGSDNQAFVDQSGDINRARINQTGDSNFATVTQMGIGNSFDLTQTGFGNAVNSTQIGDGNIIKFIQPGGATASLMEVGNNNSIDVSQAAGSNISIKLEGNGLSAKVKQN